MKKLTKYFMLLMMLIPLSLVSCSDDNENSEPSGSSIVGTWIQPAEEYGDDEIEVTFNSDGSGEVFYKSKSGTTVTQQFEYTTKTNINNDKIVTIVSDDCVLEGEYVVIITSNTLTLTNDYASYKFKRK